MLERRWHNWVIFASLAGLLAIGVAALWGGELATIAGALVGGSDSL